MSTTWNVTEGKYEPCQLPFLSFPFLIFILQFSNAEYSDWRDRSNNMTLLSQSSNYFLNCYTLVYSDFFSFDPLLTPL